MRATLKRGGDRDHLNDVWDNIPLGGPADPAKKTTAQRAVTAPKV